MSLLRWLVALVFALALSGCLWRPPPIPPDRAAHDADSGFSQDSGAESPTGDGSNDGASDTANAPDALAPNDAQGDAASEDGSDAASDAGSSGDS
jgi:hypothetical protein